MPRFISSDGLSLFYSDTGHGRPLLCLSGLTRNLDDFDFNISKSRSGKHTISDKDLNDLFESFFNDITRLDLEKK